MAAVGTWVLAARPKTLGAALAPVLIGSAIACADGGFHAPAALAALFGALLIQIATNYANDYADHASGADQSDRKGPTRATQAGLVPPRAMRNAALTAFAAALLPGAYLVYRGGWPLAVIGALSIAFGVLYTSGPKPLGYLGLGDILVLAFFGPVAAAGAHYVQAQRFSLEAAIAGLGPGLLSVVLLTVNNLRDIEEDRRAGKRTLAVRLGARFARAEALVSLTLAGAILPASLAFYHREPWFLAAALSLAFYAPPAVPRALMQPPSREMNRVLAATGKALLAYGPLLSLGWLL